MDTNNLWLLNQPQLTFNIAIMDTTHNSNHSGREDQPRDINPDETDTKHPAKTYTAKDKVPIKESELGRDQGQTPADEHIEGTISQIDQGTVELQRQNQQQNEQKHMGEDYEAEKNSDGTYKEINDNDVRDQHDSSKDWDAENSRTGRNK